jgi:hypothetical protein
MNLLLDTHVFLWLVGEPARGPVRLREGQLLENTWLWGRPVDQGKWGRWVSGRLTVGALKVARRW